MRSVGMRRVYMRHVYMRRVYVRHVYMRCVYMRRVLHATRWHVAHWVFTKVSTYIEAYCSVAKLQVVFPDAHLFRSTTLSENISPNFRVHGMNRYPSRPYISGHNGTSHILTLLFGRQCKPMM